MYNIYIKTNNCDNFWIFTGTLTNGERAACTSLTVHFFQLSYFILYVLPTVGLRSSFDGFLWTFLSNFTFPSPAVFLQNQQEVCCLDLYGSYTSVPRNSVCFLLNPQDIQWCQGFISSLFLWHIFCWNIRVFHLCMVLRTSYCTNNFLIFNIARNLTRISFFFCLF